MSSDEIFRQHTYDLGSNISGYERAEVDYIFKNYYLGTAYTAKCCVCDGVPSVQLVPKATSGIVINDPSTALVCSHCVSMFSPEQYKLRQLDRGR
jgi:hypothetical protein